MDLDAVYQRARGIRLAVFDVDGVLTDGRLYLTDGGEEIKAFSSLDGHGMRMLRESGVALAIITGRSSRCVEHRARNLGVEFVFQGADDKAAAYAELLSRAGVDAAATSYMGDDVMDLPVLTRCGLAFTVPHAPAVVQRHAHYVARAAAGMGAAREVCELIMQAQGTLEPRIAAYLA